MKKLILCDDCQPEKILHLCMKYDLGIEIQGFYSPNELDKKDEKIAMYKKLLPKEIEKHLHSPFWDLNLGSNNNRIKEVTSDYFHFAYSVAKELGCNSITVHGGYIPNTSDLTRWIERAVAFWKEFFKNHNGSIFMYLENHLEVDPKSFVDIIDSDRTGRLGVNLDIGHANSFGKLSVVEWIKALGYRIKYVHIQDNFGVKDDHLGLGKGSMDLISIFDALHKFSPEAIWALECRIDHMEESIKYLVKNNYLEQREY